MKTITFLTIIGTPYIKFSTFIPTVGEGLAVNGRSLSAYFYDASIAPNRSEYPYLVMHIGCTLYAEAL